jgi:hypothetical protein
MRPWIHKAATSAMVTAIAGGGMTATAIIQAPPNVAPHLPAQALGGPSLSPSTSASPGPSAGRSVAHSAPPSASLSPVVAVRFSPATAALATGGGGSASASSGSTAPPPAPGPTPAPSPGRSPSCTVNVTLAALRACAGISVQVGG